MANKDSGDDEQRDSDEFELGRIDPLAGGYSALDDARLIAQALGEPPPPPPRIRERYVLLERLGSGGMGEVHAAYDLDMDRKVAIKFLVRHPAQDADRARQRLEREAKAMAQIATHPNVVHVYDRGIERSRFYVVMEYIPGTTLLAWQEQARTPDEIVAAYVQAGRGLAAVHEAGLVHRDFKPANVFVTTGKGDSLRVVVGDLGLAFATDTNSARPEGVDVEGVVDPATPLTATGAQLGTIQYMAPEQLRGQAVDARCDQFAFCVSLYEALCGQRPFGKGGSEPRELLAAMEKGMPKGARLRSGKALPARVERALRRGLSLEPEARFPDMPALLDALAPRTRRRWPWLMVGVALSALALLSMRGEAPDPCQADASKKLSTFWNTAVTARLKARREALREAGGERQLGRAWDALGRNLERQADAWFQDAVALCPAKSDGLSAPGEDCLDENQRILERVSNAWLGTDEYEAASRQAELLYDDALKLSGLRDCHSASDGTTPVVSEAPVPEAPDAGVAQETLGAKLSRLDRLVRSAEYEEARELADAVMEEVTQEGLDPVFVAESKYGLGEALTYLEEHEDAARLLAEAANEAAGHGLKPLLADVSLLRLKHALVDLDDAELGRDLLAATELALRQTGELDGDTLRRAEYEEALGLLASREGEPDEASAHHQKALAIRERIEVLDEPDLAALLRAKSLSNLANVEQRQGRYEQAAARYEQALALREELLGRDNRLVGEVLLNLGLTEAAQGRYDVAIPHLERALAIERISNARPEKLLKRELALGSAELMAHVVAEAAGKRENADQHLERALPHVTEIAALHRRLAEARPADMLDQERIEEHLFLAGVHSMRQELPEARAALDAVLGIRERAWADTLCRGSLSHYLDDLVSVAFVLCEMDRAADARLKLEQARALVSTCHADPGELEQSIQEEITDPACRL